MIETIEPGAFKRSLANAEHDTIWNLEHRDFYILGRKSAGTVKIFEDEVGLRVEGDIPETSYGNDIIVSLKRGDVRHMSFKFTTVKDTWNRSEKPAKRTLNAVNLLDVAIVINPAYMQTEATMRSMINQAKVPVDNRSAEDDSLDLEIMLTEMKLNTEP